MNDNARSAEAPFPKRALVTGGSGLLGGSIVRRLLAEGADVIALVRDGDRARRLLPAVANLRIAEGDITDIDSYRGQLADLDAIFHTAATFREYLQPGVDTARLMRTNVDAVEELLHAAAEAAVPVVVHTSSTTTLRRALNGAPADEDTPPPANFEQNAYRASKVRSEEVVRRFVARYDDVRVPIVLPAWMWGSGDPGEPGSSGRLFLGIARGELRGLPRGVRHVVDARDVADVFIRAAAVGQSGRRYIAGGRRYPLSEVFGTVADAVGMTRPRELPVPVAMAAVGLLEMTSALRGRPPAATRTGVRVITEPNGSPPTVPSASLAYRSVPSSTRWRMRRAGSSSSGCLAAHRTPERQRSRCATASQGVERPPCRPPVTDRLTDMNAETRRNRQSVDTNSMPRVTHSSRALSVAYPGGSTQT